MISLKNSFKKSAHRNCLELYLEKYLPALNGNTLDIGSKNRRYDYLLKQKPVSLDLVPNKDLDVRFGDITKLDCIKDGSFDNVIIFEVLEYVPDIDRAVSEVCRVLKPNGQLLLSIPFMYRAHQDKVRYTHNFLRERIGDKFNTVEVLPIGNRYTIFLDLFKTKIMNQPKLVKYLFYLLYLPFVVPISLLPNRGDLNSCSGYFVIAKK